MTTWLIASARGLEAFTARGRVPASVGPGATLDVLRDHPIRPAPPTTAEPIEPPDHVQTAGVHAIRLRNDVAEVWSPTGAAVVALSVDDLVVLAALAGPTPSAGIDPGAVGRLIDLGLVGPAQPAKASSDSPVGLHPVPVVAAPRRDAAAVQVHAVHEGEQCVPLALGMLVAVGLSDPVLRERCDFRPVGQPVDRLLDEVAGDPRPVVALFSNYVWSVDRNLDAARRLKAIRPDAITVFGGPSVPRYEAETEAFLTAHTEVDIAVLGEAEVTVAELLHHLTDPDAARSPAALAAVAGLSFREGDQVVRTPDRERIADLADLPSPYLLGLFDGHGGGTLDQWVLETNRGCPYGCTFCDWGSATNTRVRTFPLERVLAEVERGAQLGWHGLFVADANFGMLPRDLEIAEHIVAMAERYGAPRHVDATFAKKASPRVLDIVRLFCDAGLMQDGVLSLQSVDPATLTAIHRENILPARYERLAATFANQGLPITSDIMVGLPGSTLESFKADLGYCLDIGVGARVLPTELLPNSPMNEPSYRAEHAIEINSRGEVVACATFDRADRERMTRLSDLYRMSEHLHLFDLWVRFLRWDHGIEPMDALDRLDQAVTEQPDRWPTLAFVAQWFADVQVVPVRWEDLAEDLADLTAHVLDVDDASALTAVLAAQAAALPLPGRPLPRTVELAHDVVAYLDDHAPGVAIRTDAVRPLRDYGPGHLHLSDPDGRSQSPFRLSPPADPVAHGSARWSLVDGTFHTAPDWRMASGLDRQTRVPVLGDAVAVELTGTR